MYYYRIFNLVTRSELFLPEAEPSRETLHPDVSVEFGEMPYDIMERPETKSRGGIWHYCFPETGRMLFRAEGIDFQVSGGSRIVIDTHSLPKESEKTRTFLLGTAFGALNMQRGNVPIHGASVEGEGGITIITGYSGSGKSAVLGTLAQEGFRFLADDVSVVTLENGFPEVLPAYPQRKISCEDAVALGYDVGGLEKISEDGRDKYVVCRAGEWASEHAPLSAVVELVAPHRADGAETRPEFREIRGHEALGLVMRNLYRRFFYDSAGITPELMKKILLITSGIHTYRMIRPAQGLTLRETARMIRAGCAQLGNVGPKAAASPPPLPGFEHKS